MMKPGRYLTASNLEVAVLGKNSRGFWYGVVKNEKGRFIPTHWDGHGKAIGENRSQFNIARVNPDSLKRVSSE